MIVRIHVVKYLSLEVNPLQIMRDVITKYNLTGDDLLYLMQLKIND